MRVIEKTLIVLVIIGTVLKLSQVEGGPMLAVIAYCSLAFLYCFAGALIFNNIRIRKKLRQQEQTGKPSIGQIVLSISAGIGLSILLLAILFKLNHWAGAQF